MSFDTTSRILTSNFPFHRSTEKFTHRLIPLGGIMKHFARFFSIALLTSLVNLALHAGVARHTTARDVTTGNFVPIVGTGITLQTGTLDDGLSNAIPIGFTFAYDGVPYTTLKLTTDGYVVLGPQGTAETFTNSINSTTHKPVLAPLWDDWQILSLDSLQYLSSGGVFTGEWKTVRRTGTTASDSISFQVKLFSDGHFEFVYGPTRLGGGTHSYSLGINDPISSTAHFLSLQTAGTNTFSSTTAQNTLATLPVVDERYTFTPPTPLSVSSISVPSASYPNLKAAADTLTNYGIGNPLDILITGNITETAQVDLDFVPGTLTHALVIKLDAAIATATVSGSVAAPLIRMRGVRNITIDGAQNGTGTTRGLTIENTSATGTSAIQMLEGAQSNIIRNAILKTNHPSGLTTSSGIVWFSTANISTATATRGVYGSTSYNMLENCEITGGVSGRPTNGILINGSTTAGLQDSANVIAGNSIHDFGGTGTSSAGIRMTGGTIGTIFRSNEVFHTSPAGSATTLNGVRIEGVGVGLSMIERNHVHSLMTNAAGAPNIYGLVQTASTEGNTFANNFVQLAPGDFGATTPELRGISHQGGNINVYFNSVRVGGANTTGLDSSMGFRRTTTTGITDLRNNIFYNTRVAGSGGKRHFGIVLNNTANLTSNNNAYYADGPTGILGSTDGSATNITTLADWRTATGQDGQSVSQNPNFLSATDLHINTAIPTQLESGGTPIAGIIDDFDGNARNATTPDIGGDEGTFLPQDLTPPVITHTSLANTLSTGNRTAVAAIVDVSGVAATRLWHKTSVDTSYTGVAPDSVVGNDHYFTILGQPQGTTVQYYLAAQDSAPTNNVGTLPAGGSGINPPGSTPPGTVFSYLVQNPLSGTYTVGAGGNYTTLQDALGAVVANGVSGPVTLSLTDTVYAAPGKPFVGLTEGIPSADQPDMVSAYGDLSHYYASDSPDTIGALTVTGPITGASNTNTITIRPAAGQSVRVIANGAHLIRFVDASWFIIDGINSGGASLTMRNVGGAGILLDGNSDNNTIQNVSLSCSPNNTAITLGILSGNAPDNTLIQNSYIGTSFNAVFMVNGTQPPLGVGNYVVNNTMGSSTDTIIQAGVILQNGMNTVIAGNIIQNIRRSNAGNVRGISLQTKHLNTQIYDNVVYGLFKGGTTTGVVSGINANGASGDITQLKVFNNMVFDHDYASTSATGTIVGINVGVGINDTIAHNTVDIGGTDVTAITTSALTVAGAPANAAQFWRNNIGVNRRAATGAGRAIAFFANTTTGQYTTDYNDLNVPTQAGSHVAAVTTTNYTTLAAWQATGRDSNSVSVMPNFVAPYLHINTVIPTPVNGGATPIASITTDIDGDPRDPSIPDIGADEFTVTPVPPPVVTNVTRSTRTPASGDTVGVGATITDTLGISSANIIYSINGTPQTPVPMTMTSGTPDSGTWAGTIPGSANANGNRVEIQIEATSVTSATTTTPITPANSYFAGISPMSLSGVKAVGSNRQLLYDGYYARLTGTINGPNFQTTNLGYNFQDAVGGINLFAFGLLIPPLNLGDSVVVIGRLDQFNGLTEITPDDQTADIQVVATGRTVTPIDVLLPVFNSNPELYEGRLIRLNALQRVRPTPAWPSLGQSANITMYQVNLADSIIMRIDSDTELDGTPEPTYPSLVAGVITQFDNSSPFTSGYQSQPRYIPDFAPPGPLTVLYTRSPQKPITDFNYTIDTINVPISLTIGRFQVVIDSITHTFDGDLDVFLVSPAGDSIELFTDVGSSGDNFIGTLLTDTAAISITAGTAPFTGAFRPEASVPPVNSFAYFNGSNAMGNWILRIRDDAGGDVGILHRWSIIIDESQVHDIGVASTELDAVPSSVQGSLQQTELSREMSKSPEKHAGIRIMTQPSVLSMGEDAVFTFNTVVQNFGSFVEGAYQVGWEINGIPQTAVNNTQPLDVGDVDTLVLTWSSPTPGYHTAQAWTILASDSNFANDTSAVLNFTILPTNTVFAEGFNGTIPPFPTGWHVKNLDGGGTTQPWFQGNPAVFAPFEGSGYIAANYQGANGFFIDQWLVTPNFGATSPALLNYRDSLTFWQRSPSGSPWKDSIQIRVSTTDTAVASFTIVLDYFETDTIGWRRKAYALPQGARYVAFRYLHYDGGPSGNYSNYVGLDDIRVTRFNTQFADGFESYTPGVQLVVQNPVDWVTWSGPPGTGEDPFVSNARAFNGANSVVIVQNNDLVHRIGPFTTGTHRMSFRAYIPTSKAGYFNTLAVFTPPSTFNWAMEAYFDVSGGRLFAGSATPVPFTYVHDVWQLVEVIVDLDSDTARFRMNGSLIHSWKWTRGASGGGSPRSLAANDFYGATANDQMYFDNYFVGVDSPIVGVDEDGLAIPMAFTLEQNYPNPFNPTTTIKYALPRESFVTLKVYNVLGQEVARLVNEDQRAGYITVTWDGRNNVGSLVSSGMYFYRIEARPTGGGEVFTQVKKMLMLK